MQEAVVSPIASWESFYVIIGTAAATLTGLMFVVVTLITGIRSRASSPGDGIAAFSTPSVVHFGTALLVATTAGDQLRLGPPMGDMVLDPESDRDLLLVAGGTGLAPLKALVDQVAREGPARRVDLFVGARTQDAFYDRADLQRLQEAHPWLTVTLAVSEDAASALERGTVGEVAARYGPWTSREVFVAGPGVMVDDTVSRLLEQGVRRERIRTEVFAPSRPGPDVDGKVRE